MQNCKKMCIGCRFIYCAKREDCIPLGSCDNCGECREKISEFLNSL